MPTTKKRGRPRKVVAVEEETQHELEYFLQLEVGGRIYFGDGMSMLEALNNLEQPQKIVSKGLLRIQVGDKKRERPLVIYQMKRLFYPLARVVIAKQLEVGF